MWEFLVVLCLLLPGSGMSLPPAWNESSLELQTPPVTPTLLPTHSEAPALLLNLGLNFQVKVRSQGKGPPHKGPGRPASRPALPSSLPPAPAQSRAEGPGGSVGPGTGPAEKHAPGPTTQASNGSSSARAPPALWASAHPLQPQEHSRELEFQVDIGLTTGLGQERVSVLGGGGGSGSRHPVLQDPHLPGLRVGIASQAGGTGLFGYTLPPEPWKPTEWNVTGGPEEESGDPHPTAEWTPGPGPAESSGSPTASPGSEDAFVAVPACLPNRPEACGSPRPEPGAPPPPGAPLFVPLHSDWDAALAAWGPAWAAHVYGAGSLFALLALLALLGLLALPCRCRLAAPEARLLSLLLLLLLGAGGARAGLLFGQADGRRRGLLPAAALRLLRDLPLPCLTSALATALLLLSRRPRAGLSARAGPRRPCLLTLLLLAHFSAAAGAVLAAERLPALLLASRGLFALLAALLSATALGGSCLGRGESAQIYDLRSAPPPARQALFASGRQWSRAARAALPAALFGLLSAGLHAYSVLHALGYGLSPALFGPWPWWALQLSCRLCEAGVGLPLASLGLYLTCCRCRCRCRCLALPAPRAAAKPALLPGSLHWALSQHEKLPVCDPAARSEPGYLPLCAVPAQGPIDAGPGAPSWSVLRLAAEAGDPTADFHPPSPIDLRRSIDEALCSEGLLRSGGAFSASSILSLGSAPEGDPRRAASCLGLAQPQPDREAGLPSAASPRKKAAGRSLSHGSAPQSPPAPGDPGWLLPAVSQETLASVGQLGAHAALLQEEFVDLSQQIDALSLGSDTIDL